EGQGGPLPPTVTQGSEKPPLPHVFAVPPVRASRDEGRRPAGNWSPSMSTSILAIEPGLPSSSNLQRCVGVIHALVGGTPPHPRASRAADRPVLGPVRTAGQGHPLAAEQPLEHLVALDDRLDALKGRLDDREQAQWFM